jgi:putative ABC transport system permease protein
VQKDLQARLPPDVTVRTMAEMEATEKGFWNANTPIGFIFLLGAAVGLLVGAVIVYQILYTDVSDHIKEYATLKAMGYTDWFLIVVVIEEALILSVIGFPMGFFLAQGLYKVSRDATHLPLFMTMPRALMVFALTIGMCCGAGLLAIKKLKTADPAEVF